MKPMSYQALLFCPDEKTARVVQQVLVDLEFAVEVCGDPFNAVKKLTAQRFDAVVVDCDNEQNATLMFKSARNSSLNQSSLTVAIVEGQSGVAKAFRSGANLVLAKPINVEQSKGTLRVARGLLRKAEAARPASSSPPLSAEAAKVMSAAAANPVESLAGNSAIDRSEPAPTVASSSGPAAHELRAPSLELAAVAENENPSAPLHRPWPSPSEPAAPPSAAALPGAADTTADSHAAMAKASAETSESTVKASSAAVSSSAAAAPAPAKEKTATPAATSPLPPAPLGPPAQPTSGLAPVAGATRKSAPVADPAANASARSSRSSTLLLLVALVLLAVAAYYGWTQMHPSAPPAGQKPTAVLKAAPASALPATPEPAAGPELDAVTPSAVVSPSATPNPENVTDAKAASAAAKPRTPAPAHSLAPPTSLLNLALPAADKTLASIVATGAASAALPAAPGTTHAPDELGDAQLIKKVAPVYPAEALSAHLEGSVKLEAGVGSNGQVTDVRVISGDPILARAAQEAVKQWQYKPAILNSQPVAAHAAVTLDFTLPR